MRCACGVYAGSGGQCMRDGDVQLVGGNHNYNGLVQVCQNAEWQYFCLHDESDLNQQNGQVVCRSLNHSIDSKSSLYT